MVVPIQSFALALAACAIFIATSEVYATMNSKLNASATIQQNHPYAGRGVSSAGDGLKSVVPNGRYPEAGGGRESHYEGRHEDPGNHISSWDEPVFTADGDFIDDVLHHGGMILYRQK